MCFNPDSSETRVVVSVEIGILSPKSVLFIEQTTAFISLAMRDQMTLYGEKVNLSKTELRLWFGIEQRLQRGTR